MTRFIAICMHPPEFADAASSLALRRGLDPNVAAGRAHRQQAGGAARDIGQVDVLHLRLEARPLDRLQIDQIVDQLEQMTAGHGDVARIAGIVAAQRPFRLLADRLGMGDDLVERPAQRLLEPLARTAPVCPRHVFGPVAAVGRAASAATRGGRAVKAGKWPAPSIIGTPLST